MSNSIKLLVSPKNLQEAEVVINSRADFVDCKNPKEGSLGANFPWIIKSMKELIPPDSPQLLSATIGNFPNLPGSASLAALGAAVSGADIIKIGLKGPKSEEQGIRLMKKVVKAVKEYNEAIIVVAAGYADRSRMKTSPEFLMLPTIASQSGADIAMLDTYYKDGKCIFDFLKIDQLLKFKEKAETADIDIALAGSLKLEDLPRIKQISPYIIGVRSAVCEGFDRNNGTIKAYLIEKFKNELN